jgi:hypothetical protein
MSVTETYSYFLSLMIIIATNNIMNQSKVTTIMAPYSLVNSMSPKLTVLISHIAMPYALAGP